MGPDPEAALARATLHAHRGTPPWCRKRWTPGGAGLSGVPGLTVPVALVSGPGRHMAQLSLGRWFDRVPGPELHLVQPGVQTALRDELLVGAALRDGALVEDEDHVRPAYRGQPVSDGD